MTQSRAVPLKYIVWSLALHGSALAADVGIDTFPAIAAASMNASELRIFPDADGVARDMVLGIPVADLPETQSSAQEKLETVLGGFYAELGFAPDSWKSVDVVGLDDITDDLLTASFVTKMHGLPVHDSGGTATFRRSTSSLEAVHLGAMHSMGAGARKCRDEHYIVLSSQDALNHGWWALEESGIESQAALGEPYEALPNFGELEIEFAYLAEVSGEASYVPRYVSIVLGFDAANCLATWRVATDFGVADIDAATGEVVQLAHTGNAASGTTDTLAKRYVGGSPDYDLGSQDGTEVRSEVFDYVTSGGGRQYKLKYFNTSWGIHQVVDVDASTYEVLVPPQTGFLASTPDHQFRQSQTYFWTKQARDYLASNVFASIAPYDTASVLLEIDLAQVGCGSQQACYLASNNNVEYLKQGDGNPWNWALYVHEYGHYFVDVYGGLSGFFNPGVDEGGAINEAIADVIVQVLGRFPDTHNGRNGVYSTNMKIRTARQYADNSQHSTITLPLQYGTAPHDRYFYGDFFRQAMWEVLNNYNCSVTSCAMTGGGRATWGTNIGWTSAANARQAVVRGIAVALKAIPSSTTFTALCLQIKLYISSTYGASVATAFANVLAHHGMSI